MDSKSLLYKLAVKYPDRRRVRGSFGSHCLTSLEDYCALGDQCHLLTYQVHNLDTGVFRKLYWAKLVTLLLLKKFSMTGQLFSICHSQSWGPWNGRTPAWVRLPLFEHRRGLQSSNKDLAQITRVLLKGVIVYQDQEKVKEVKENNIKATTVLKTM